ncbi:MAG: gluconokinase [Candidatus Obscuribacterales bacterium]|nr:gluconokinase [Candidatus Obscuribacterales bacterium]
MIVVIMGPAGSGKTAIGTALAQALGWSFSDADQFHSASNISKMETGIPLTDEDRRPWLESMHQAMSEASIAGKDAVFACSALRRSYRDILIGELSDVHFVYLKASPELLAKRLSERQGHFMKPGMLTSQLQALEEPSESEALIVDAALSIAEIVQLIRTSLNT